MKGMFITVEGGEGAGKTTQIEFINQYLLSKRIKVLTTREPGGTSLGEKIRSMVLNQGEEMAMDAELLLMFAARAEHLEKVIIPAIALGYWVICDRFTDSTYAYQGGGRHISVSRIKQLEKWVQGSFAPNLTLLLDIPAKECLSRVKKRGDSDRFEKEPLGFYERVRETYLERAKQDSQRVRVIDATRPVQRVREQINNELFQLHERQSSCPRCGVKLSVGKAIQSTFAGGIPDFIGGSVVTVSLGGPGKIVSCLKCSECGYSITCQLPPPEGGSL